MRRDILRHFGDGRRVGKSDAAAERRSDGESRMRWRAHAARYGHDRYLLLQIRARLTFGSLLAQRAAGEREIRSGKAGRNVLRVGVFRDLRAARRIDLARNTWFMIDLLVQLRKTETEKAAVYPFRFSLPPFSSAAPQTCYGAALPFHIASAIRRASLTTSDSSPLSVCTLAGSRARYLSAASERRP